MEQQLKRRAHRKNYEFQSIAHRIWDAMRLERVPGGEEGSTAVVSGALEVEPGFDPSADGVDKATFVNLMIKIHFLIICPPVRLDYCALRRVVIVFDVRIALAGEYGELLIISILVRSRDMVSTP